MNDNPKSISYVQLGVIAGSFVVGLIVGLFAIGAQSSAATSLTPMALIGFVISVLLGGASIVLAVVAISLGRTSENVLVARGDDSLRLQTEIYTKTADALQKIASSTDVTEKRIEDMISGRVSDISHDLARSLPRARQSPERLEADIRKSIMHSMRHKETEEQRQAEKAREEERETQYQTAHKRAQLCFANKQYLKISKLDHGMVDDEGEDLFDAIYTRRDDKIALSTFRPTWNEKSIKIFILNALDEIKKGTITQLVMLLFTDAENERKTEAFERILALVPPELGDRIQLVVSTFDDVEENVDAIDVANHALNRSGACEVPQMDEQSSPPG